MGTTEEKKQLMSTASSLIINKPYDIIINDRQYQYINILLTFYIADYCPGSGNACRQVVQTDKKAT